MVQGAWFIARFGMTVDGLVGVVKNCRNFLVEAVYQGIKSTYHEILDIEKVSFLQSKDYNDVSIFILILISPKRATCMHVSDSAETSCHFTRTSKL